MKQPLDHLRSRKKPVSRRVPIALDSEQADAAAAATLQAFAKRQVSDNNPGDRRLLTEAEEAEERADELNEQVRNNSAWFVVKSLGPNRYEELQAQHPPTEKQRKDARKEQLGTLAWNPDTFPLDLLPACVHYVADLDDEGHDVLEQLSPEYVKDMYEGDDWNLGEVNALLQAAVEVNQNRRVVDMGNGFGRTRRS